MVAGAGMAELKASLFSSGVSNHLRTAGSAFRMASSPSAALGANILGAVVGGLLENLSLALGMRALLLLSIGLYCLAGIGLWLRRREAVVFSQAPAGASGL